MFLTFKLYFQKKTQTGCVDVFGIYIYIKDNVGFWTSVP